MATLWLLLALAAGAAAINPLSSRCIYMMYPDVCAVLPIGLEDRWFPPKDFMSISFAVGCGYTLGPQGDAVIELDDITGDHSRKKKPNFGMEGIDTVIMNPFRLFESDVTVGAMEPGTQIFNVSLVAKHNNTVIDFMLFCAEIVPSDTAFKPTAPVPRDLDPTAPISGRPFQAYFPKPANSGPENLRDHAASDHLPVRVMYLGDLGRFDGMKRFMYMNMRYLDRKDVEVAYLDLTNGGMGVMGRLLLEAGVDIYQHSVSCPRELCESAADFYRFVLTLHQYDAFEQVPAPWQSVFKPVVDILKGFDAIVMVRFLVLPLCFRVTPVSPSPSQIKSTCARCVHLNILSIVAGERCAH